MPQLQKNRFFGKRPGPVVTIVMDGIGLSPRVDGDAVKAAYKPNLDALFADKSRWLSIAAHGTAVGMPSDEDMGNSEVGHNALGAGRVFAQGAKLVAEAIASGKMFTDAAWNEVVANALKNSSILHFMGLFSDGNVHSHIDHLKAMIAQAHKQGVKKVAIHALIDGRDVGETSALEYTEPFEAWLQQFGPGYSIASGGGRMKITMDRYEADWAMVERGWKTHVLAEGPVYPSASAAVKDLRVKFPGTIDQDLPPFIVGQNGKAFAPIVDGDSVIFFNFRGDRAIEISKAFDGTVPFERVRQPKVCYAGMMQYDGDLKLPARFLVVPPAIDQTLGALLADNGIFQFAASETQKFGHVTYFWNGNRSGYINEKFEKYQEVTSDRVSFDERPWMKAAEVTDALIAYLLANPKGGTARINLANGDMVGHTGSMLATRIAVETVDLCLGRILPVVKKLGGIAIITADHGNADEMYETDKKGAVKMKNGVPAAKTAHTLNPVPFIIYDPQFAGEWELSGAAKPGLGNYAATALTLMGYEAPELYLPSLVKVK